MSYSTLPEVVPDPAPQALSQAEAYDRAGADIRDQKFTVVDDPKPSHYALNGTPVPHYTVSPLTPAPPYRPSTAGDPSYPNYAAGTGVAGWENVSRKDSTVQRDWASEVPPKKDDRRICGMKKVFLIILALALIMIVAGVGGGVGAIAARQKASEKAEAADQSSTPPPTASAPSSAGTPSPTDETTPSVSSTASEPSSPAPTSAPTSSTRSSSASPRPTTTRQEIIDVGFRFKAFSGDKFSGKSTEVQGKPGFVDLPFSSTSYKWDPKGSGCCVTFCQGTSKSVGWRCTEFEREESSSSFDRLFIGCGDDGKQENSRCS